MKTETLFNVTPQGVERVEITRTTIDVGQQIAEQFASGVIRKVDRVAYIGGSFGFSGMATNKCDEIWWTVQVVKLVINAPFIVIDDVVSPSFDGTGPSVRLEWEVPETIRLRLSVCTITNRHGINAGDQYLHAFDSVGIAYRLPVSNVYEDCRVCSGKFNSESSSHAESLKLALDQFERSPWNIDLYGASDKERKNTQRMFRFKPDKDKFEQLPMMIGSNYHWTSLCESVANVITNNYIVV